MSPGDTRKPSKLFLLNRVQCCGSKLPLPPAKRSGTTLPTALLSTLRHFLRGPWQCFEFLGWTGVMSMYLTLCWRRWRSELNGHTKNLCESTSSGLNNAEKVWLWLRRKLNKCTLIPSQWTNQHNYHILDLNKYSKKKKKQNLDSAVEINSNC